MLQGTEAMEVRDLDCVWHLLILVSPGERTYTVAIGRNFRRKKQC